MLMLVMDHGMSGMDCIWEESQKKRRSQSAMPARPPLPTATPLERRSSAVARDFALLHGASELHPALCGSTLCAERGACSSRQPCACCAQHAPTGDSIPGRGRCVVGGQAGGPMLSPSRRSGSTYRLMGRNTNNMDHPGCCNSIRRHRGPPADRVQDAHDAQDQRGRGDAQGGRYRHLLGCGSPSICV